MKNCRTTITIEKDKSSNEPLLKIKDDKTSIGEYILGNQLRRILLDAQKKENINMGLSKPLTGLVSNKMAIQFTVTKNIEKAQEIIRKHYPDLSISNTHAATEKLETTIRLRK